MFLDYYGLREQPFGVTPNPRFLFLSPSHREVLASLLYAIQSDLGFSAVIADPGMGKTTLLFDLLERYRYSANTAFLFHTQCNSQDLLRYLLTELGVETDGHDSFLMHEKFKEVLLQSLRENKKVLLVLDEAQDLDDSVLETVRLLSNFETSNSKLLHIVLSGQTNLARKLMSPEMAQLFQRIAFLNRLKPLTYEETCAYIHHRLEVAGYDGGPLFTSEALEKISTFSAGVPRTINRLCLASMSIGCALNQLRIQGSVVNEVIADLNLSTLLPLPVQSQQKAARISAKSRSITRVPSLPKESCWNPSRPLRLINHGYTPKTDLPTESSAQCATPVSNPDDAPEPFEPPPINPVVPSGRQIRTAVAPPRPLGKAALRAPIEPLFKLLSSQLVTIALVLTVCIFLTGWLIWHGLSGGSRIFANGVQSQAKDNPSNATGVQQTATYSTTEPAQPKVNDPTTPKVNDPTTPKQETRPVSDFLRSSAPISAGANSPGSSVTSTGPNVTLPSFGTRAATTPGSRLQVASQSKPPSEDATAPNIAIASEAATRSLADAMGSVLNDSPRVKLDVPVPPPSGEVVPGHVIQNPKPTYPDDAKRLGIEGPVVLSAVITRQGKVTQIHRVSGDARLASAAADAVRRWKYKAYTLNGNPVEASADIIVNFTLSPK
jgi:general secretion pathway protein A